MLETLRLIGALLLIFVIPGIMLVQALFPRKGELDTDFDWLYRFGLGVGLSIVITILVSFGLNSLGENPDTGLGYVTTVPITASLVALTLAFFIAAWLRGGLQFMGRLHPALIRFPPSDPKDDDIPRISDRRQRFRHQELMKEKFETLGEIKKAERLMDIHSGEQREYYRKRRESLLARLSELEKSIENIEIGLPVKEPEKEDEAHPLRESSDEEDAAHE